MGFHRRQDTTVFDGALADPTPPPPSGGCESLRPGLCGVSCLPFNPTRTTPAESAGVDGISVSRCCHRPLLAGCFAAPYQGLSRVR